MTSEPIPRHPSQDITMGMTYFASHYHVVAKDAVRAVIPREYEALEATIAVAAQDSGQDPEDVWTDLSMSDERPWSDQANKAIEEALASAVEAFKRATRLDLSLGWADGDVLRGSDLCEEWFWHVNGLVPNPDCIAFERTHPVHEQWVLSCG